MLQENETQLTVAELIAALSKMDPTAGVCVAIRQHNKRYGRYVPVLSTMPRDSRQWWVGVLAATGEALISVHLPGRAILSNWPDDSYFLPKTGDGGPLNL
jgi:hypothetical protein